MRVRAPTTAELEQLGRDVAADFAGRDGISGRVDAETLVSRALKGIEVRGEYRRGLVQGVRQGFARRPRARPRRRRSPHLQAGRHHPGEDLRLIAVPVLGELDQDVLDRLLGKDQALTKHLPDPRKVRSGARREARRGRDPHTGLPKAPQEHRLFLRAYVAAVVDAPEYEGAMARSYPTDTAALVMGIDAYFLKKGWPRCLAAIAAVEQRAVTMRGSTFCAPRPRPRRWPLARKHLIGAIGKEPSLPQLYDSLIDVTMTQQKYADTAKWLDAAEKNAGVTFTASKEGKAWLKAQRPH